MFYKLPTNLFQFEHNSLVMYKKFGLNGQIRIIESTDALKCSECFGSVFAMQPTAAANADYVSFDVSFMNGSLKKSKADRLKGEFVQNDHLFTGKQRGVFGPYLVFNKDEFTLEFWGYKKVSDTDQQFVKHFTSTKVD